MPLFKAYDIRGLVPEELDAETARRIGSAVARYLAGTVAVAWDAREHSPELREALVAGLLASGASVIEIGLAATPMLYFAVDRLGCAGGVMVTASHNPRQYNGMKICGRNAVPIGEASGLREIERLAAEGVVPAERPGKTRREDVTDAYVEHVARLCPEPAALHVAIDCGNGMAGVALEPLLERLPLRVERLYFEPDGRFPNHPADPLVEENLEDLRAAVRRSGAGFGVAFDGDADRAIFVDERAEPIPSDRITALLAGVVLRREPGARILYDLRSSRATAEAIEAAGGVPETCRVGHSFVKAQMREQGAAFAGELSGHFYFRFSETLVADDGIAAFLALVEVLSREGKPLSELVAPFDRYSASGEISHRIADPPGFLARIEAAHADAEEISHLDGLSVRHADYWFNLRASNTEPLVRLNLEARTPALMAEQRDRLVAEMQAAGAS